MVLTARSGVLVLVLLAGCSESLFGARPATDGDAGAGSDAGDAGEIAPGACTAPCVADAAAEFDGSPGGIGSHWRYLDDSRSPQRTWSPMTASGGEMSGAGQNHITSCGQHPDRAACKTLPSALLVSSTGVTSPTDPAIELTAFSGQVLKLALHAYLPAGGDQTIWLYRNSREDTLFKAIATAGTPLDHEITLDALPGDRFLVAVAPIGDGAADVGVELFATAASQPLPSSCQLALRFDTVVANSTSDLICGRRVFTHLDTTGKQTALVQTTAPYIELISAISNPAGTYLHDFDGSSPLDYSHDVTVQLWTNLRSFVAGGAASVFSDLSAGAGLAISILPGSPATISATTRTTTSSLVEATAQVTSASTWHFIRVVRTADHLQLCIDGGAPVSMDAALVMVPATLPPDLGKDLEAPSASASLDGELDDVRVISGALPCE